MAVVFQSGLFMIWLMSAVTYAWPWCTLAGGCSLMGSEGVIQLTEGSVPLRAAAKKSGNGLMLPSWWSVLTSVKTGSGFQIPGVLALCLTGWQVRAESFVQSGW